MPTSTLAPLVKSKVKLRSATKGLSSADLEKLIASLSSLLEAQKEKEQSKEAAAKKAKIAKIKALMAESGLSAEDLKAGRRGRPAKAGAKTAVSKKSRKAVKKVAPKYRLVVSGTEHLWTGRGRTPKVFQEYFDSGKSKESCAIK